MNTVQSEINEHPLQLQGCSLTPSPPEQRDRPTEKSRPWAQTVLLCPGWGFFSGHRPCVANTEKALAPQEHTPRPLSPVAALTTLLVTPCPPAPQGHVAPVYLGRHERGRCRLWGPSLDLNMGPLTSWVILGKLLSLCFLNWTMESLKRLLDR